MHPPQAKQGVLQVFERVEWLMGMPRSAKCPGRARLFLMTLLLTELGKSLGARQHGRERGSTSLNMRRQLLLAQSQKERYKTGIAGCHLVSYENHPFQLSKDQRKLDEVSPFQPIRIVFDVLFLEERRNSSTAESIQVLEKEVLPAVSSFWSQTLQVVPVEGNLTISPTELEGFTHCGNKDLAQVPISHLEEGIPDADVVIYVSASDTFCAYDREIAVAIACNMDQFDRPTAGALNVCLDNLLVDQDRTMDAILHEVAHVLGRSIDAGYRFFWDPETKQPRTARPFVPRTVSCADGEEREMLFPDENTLQIGLDGTGRRFATMVTPKVRQVSRNQFDCQNLTGARLENQPSSPSDCYGDEWDERFTLDSVSSPLTLALFEDSGWYKANYTASQMSSWGLGAGCDFVTEPCLTISNNETQIPLHGRGYFCSQVHEKACSPDLTHKAGCSIFDFEYFVPKQLPDVPYQYFSGDPSRGGPRQTDYCPVYASTYDNLLVEELDCTNGVNSPSFNVYSETYGSDSKCIPSTAGQGLCYRTACVKEEMALRINVVGEWLQCEFDFQRLTIRVGQGLIQTILTCPRLTQACPELFCPFNCAGRGICNFSNMVGGVLSPVCECFDQVDLSPGCTESLVPEGLIPTVNSDSPSMIPSSVSGSPSIRPSTGIPSSIPSDLNSQSSPSTSPFTENPTKSPTISFTSSSPRTCLSKLLTTVTLVISSRVVF